MNANGIRELVSAATDKLSNLKDESGIIALQIGIPVAQMILQGEIAAQLAELNENLNRLFAKDVVTHDPGHSAAALQEFAAGLKPMDVK